MRELLFFSFFFHVFCFASASDKCVVVAFGDIQVQTGINTTICNRPKPYIYAFFLLPPYSDDNMLTRPLKDCCPNLSKAKGNLMEIKFDFDVGMENIEMVMQNVDFIFPFLADQGATTLYGWNFIPVIPTSSLFYITRDDTNTLENLILSCLNLYPLVIICITTAMIAGFLAWILETWFNEGEFPRPFAIGWFEGFWWSFISMTTVGYGDKTPKSVVGRVFSVLWILMGIALFGIVTAEITNVLVAANNPTPPSVQGKTVGVLHHREYDKSYVAQNGGKLHENPKIGRVVNNKTVAFQMTDDVFTMIKNLRNKSIDGFVLEKRTMQYILELFNQKAFRDKLVKDYSQTELKDVDWMINHTLRTEKEHTGEKMMYGILVKDKAVYTYFKEGFQDNRMLTFADKALQWNKKTKLFERKIEKVLFDPKGKYFVNAIITIAAIVGFIVLFGSVYEFRRRRTNGEMRA